MVLQFIRLVRIGKIIVGQIFESADMIECMVSDAVAAIYYHFCLLYTSRCV